MPVPGTQAGQALKLIHLFSHCILICIIKSEFLTVFLMYSVKIHEKLKNYGNPVIYVMSHSVLQLLSSSSNTRDSSPPKSSNYWINISRFGRHCTKTLTHLAGILLLKEHAMLCTWCRALARADPGGVQWCGCTPAPPPQTFELYHTSAAYRDFLQVLRTLKNLPPFSLLCSKVFPPPLPSPPTCPSAYPSSKLLLPWLPEEQVQAQVQGGRTPPPNHHCCCRCACFQLNPAIAQPSWSGQK